MATRRMKLGCRRTLVRTINSIVGVFLGALLLAAPAVAQNPLRGMPSQATPVDNRGFESNLPPEVFQALYKPKAPQKDRTSDHAGFSKVESSNSYAYPDASVQQASHVGEKKHDLAPVVEMLDRLHSRESAIGEVSRSDSHLSSLNSPLRPLELKENVEVASSVESQVPGSENKIQFAALAEKLAYNTIVVLTVGVCFILIAKQWYVRKPGQGKAKSVGFEVVNSLKLAGKASLLLVDVNGERLVVATDTGGIKSVVKLNEGFAGDFADVMDGLDESETVPSQLDVKNEDVYSLAAIGRTRSAVSEPQQPKDGELSEIEQKIEAALAEAGIKDMFLKSLRAGN